jgi:hypothetical protein
MTTYGEVDIIRELLGIDAGQEEEKIVRLRALSNVWLNSYASATVLATLSAATKNAAVNYHVVFLFRLSAESISGEMGDATFQWKDEGKELLKQSLLQGADVYEIYKVNPP